MIISIHQPNFMPWHPFFEKIQQSDLFVFLTHCQFEKGGYQNRFNYNNKWYTMSTSRGLIPIIDKTYINPQHSWNRIKEQLPDKEISLSQFDNDISDSLVETNINIIKRILNFQHFICYRIQFYRFYITHNTRNHSGNNFDKYCSR